ncbi:hypothetical protein [Colwellia piezophila]|uniref:hypothetical protein n=1 Tax=Colwellia piezophila TaxID=211668 RepID=UPI000369A344|nr:hypothetical protein [Colwellia piezophila]
MNLINLSKSLKLLLLSLFSSCCWSGNLTDLNLVELGELDVFTASIFRAHIHNKNQWMFSYNYSVMHMEQMAQGKDKITSEQVLENYMATPTEMDMTMQMFHLMYAPSNNLTTMIALHYMNKEMRHQTRMGGEFTTRSSGLGDIKLGINYKFYEYDYDVNSNYWYSLFNFTLPVGSIDKKAQTPGGFTTLPYPMQLGSGSYQTEIGLGFTSTFTDRAWGIVSSIQTTLTHNDADYHHGNLIQVDLWYKQALSDTFSFNILTQYYDQDRIYGEDARLNNMIVPTADVNNQGFRRVDLTLGVGWLLGELSATQQSMSIDYKKPIWQDVNGIQLRLNWNVSVNWQVNF